MYSLCSRDKFSVHWYRNFTLGSYKMDKDRYNITKEKVIDMLYEDRILAREQGKLAAAISVSKLFGDTIGLFKPAEAAPTTINNFVRPFTKQDKELMEALGMNFANTQIDPQS